MQNFFSNTGPEGASSQDQSNSTPWWLRYIAKVVGVAAGIVAMAFGVMAAFSLHAICIVSGIWMICAGFLMVVLEAPFCCPFLDFVQQISNHIESRPPWQKALLYLCISIPPIAMCLGISTILGSGSMFTVSVIYGIQVLGKKATREEMVAAANESVGAFGKSGSMSAGLTSNIQGQDVEASRQPK